MLPTDLKMPVLNCMCNVTKDVHVCHKNKLRNEYWKVVARYHALILVKRSKFKKKKSPCKCKFWNPRSTYMYFTFEMVYFATAQTNFSTISIFFEILEFVTRQIFISFCVQWDQISSTYFCPHKLVFQTFVSKILKEIRHLAL